MSHRQRYGTDVTRPRAPRGGAALQHWSLFVKADRPRQIDSQINYFGETAPAPRHGARRLSARSRSQG